MEKHWESEFALGRGLEFSFSRLHLKEQSPNLDQESIGIRKESKDQDAVAFKQTLVKGSKFNRIYGVKLEKAGFMSTYF